MKRKVDIKILELNDNLQIDEIYDLIHEYEKIGYFNGNVQNNDFIIQKFLVSNTLDENEIKQFKEWNNISFRFKVLGLYEDYINARFKNYIYPQNEIDEFNVIFKLAYSIYLSEYPQIENSIV